MIAERSAVVVLDRHAPVVLHLLNEFRRSQGLPPGGVSDDGSQWFGLVVEGEVVCAFADRRYGGTIFVDNICPCGGRRGILAAYAVLRLYRAAVDEGYAREVLGAVLVQNGRVRGAMRKIFGDAQPMAEVYRYGKEAN